MICMWCKEVFENQILIEDVCLACIIEDMEIELDNIDIGEDYD